MAYTCLNSAYSGVEPTVVSRSPGRWTGDEIVVYSNGRVEQVSGTDSVTVKFPVRSSTVQSDVTPNEILLTVTVPSEPLPDDSKPQPFPLRREPPWRSWTRGRRAAPFPSRPEFHARSNPAGR